MTLKVGIIGLGIGEAHLEALSTDSNIVVQGICDLNLKKLKSVNSKYPNIKLCTSDAKQILTEKTIDLVVIASYEQYHASQALTAIEHGKHVFVEKPFCQTIAEARSFRKALKKHKRKLSSNLILRKYSQFINFKQHISNGLIGKPYLLEGDYNYGRIEKLTNSWRGAEPFYSVMYSGGVHIVDLLLWLSGFKVKEVSCMSTKCATNNTKFKFDDTMLATLRFSNDAIAKITANFGCAYPHSHLISIYGTKGTLENRVSSSLYYKSADEQTAPIEIKRGAKIKKGELSLSFARSLISKKSHEINEEELFAAMSVCFAIQESASKGKIVQVKYV